MNKSKRKNIYLAIGFFAFILLAYKVSISRTINLKKEYASLQTDAKRFETIFSDALDNSDDKE